MRCIALTRALLAPPSPSPARRARARAPVDGAQCDPFACGAGGIAQCCQAGSVCPHSVCPICQCPNCAGFDPVGSVGYWNATIGPKAWRLKHWLDLNGPHLALPVLRSTGGAAAGSSGGSGVGARAAADSSSALSLGMGASLLTVALVAAAVVLRRRRASLPAPRRAQPAGEPRCRALVACAPSLPTHSARVNPQSPRGPLPA